MGRGWRCRWRSGGHRLRPCRVWHAAERARWACAGGGGGIGLMAHAAASFFLAIPPIQVHIPDISLIVIQPAMHESRNASVFARWGWHHMRCNIRQYIYIYAIPLPRHPAFPVLPPCRCPWPPWPMYIVLLLAQHVRTAVLRGAACRCTQKMNDSTPHSLNVPEC